MLKTRLDVGSIDRMMHDAVINVIANHNLKLTGSPKKSMAAMAVVTISKLPSKETVAAEVIRRPVISSIGAAMSKTIMATT
jgi:hypothetical protein